MRGTTAHCLVRRLPAPPHGQGKREHGSQARRCIGAHQRTVAAAAPTRAVFSKLSNVVLGVAGGARGGSRQHCRAAHGRRGTEQRPPKLATGRHCPLASSPQRPTFPAPYPTPIRRSTSTPFSRKTQRRRCRSSSQARALPARHPNGRPCLGPRPRQHYSTPRTPWLPVTCSSYLAASLLLLLSSSTASWKPYLQIWTLLLQTGPKRSEASTSLQTSAVPENRGGDNG
jgi:hypothetical protein